MGSEPLSNAAAYAREPWLRDVGIEVDLHAGGRCDQKRMPRSRPPQAMPSSQPALRNW